MPYINEGTPTLTTTVDNSVIEEFQADFRVSFYEDMMFPQIATEPTAINGKSFEFTFYGTLPVKTTPLVEADEVDSTPLAPTKKDIIGQQHGEVVTTTDMADWQTRSKASRAAARVISINAMQTLTRICMEAADLSTNVIRPNGRANDGSIVAGDILTADVLEDAYTELSANNVPTLIDGLYVLVAHDRVLSDIRSSSDWITINRYNKDSMILRNEIGTYKGFKILRNNLSTVGADAGAGNVDVYNSYALGLDAIAYGEKSAPEIVVTSDDKLRRFHNIGWKWIGVHKILRQESLQLIKCAASRGNNT